MELDRYPVVDKLTTSMPPNPQFFANPIQRRIVGSSLTASAWLGLSMTKPIVGSELHDLQSR